MKDKNIRTDEKIFYLCDRTQCKNCSASYGLCFHTSDKTHAKYKDDERRQYEKMGDCFFEIEVVNRGTI